MFTSFMAPHHGAMQLVNSEVEPCLWPPLLPAWRDKTEMYLCAKAELVKCYKVHTCMMAVLWQGLWQEVPR